MTVHHHSHHQQVASKVTFGFWVYIMTDAIMFATLFAVYAVLHNNTFGGPTIRDVATLHHVLIQTLVFLFGVLSFGMSSVSFYRGNRGSVLFWLFVAFVFGALFLGIEIGDGKVLMDQGYDWTKSAFLSSYFGFLGIHGLHMILALVWLVVLFFQTLFQGLTGTMQIRFICFGYFWNFLSLIWIIAFTLMFLMGAV